MIEHPDKTLVTTWAMPNATPEPSTMPIGTPVPPPDSEVPSEDAHRIDYLVDSAEERSADFYSVMPPSNFHLYDFKKLSVMQLRGRHQAKFNRAAAENNYLYLVEGVSSMLGDNISAKALTVGDFDWLLYWILFASYPTAQRMVTITCNNPDHVMRTTEAVPKEERLTEASLRYLHTYVRPKIKETELDIEALKAVDVSALTAHGLQLGYYSVADKLVWEDMPDESDNAEEYFIFELACYLKGGTIEERCEIVKDLNVKALSQLKAYRVACKNHGVLASITSTCKECGAVAETVLSASASDFL